jgi:hypothetical protein
MSESLVMFAGLPSSGKSTFLGLLFVAMDSPENSTLKLVGFQGDYAYVNSLADRLHECLVAIRTKTDQAAGFDAEVETEAGSRARLRMPDFSGETWREALDSRSWTTSIETSVIEAQGFCVFINVAQVENDGSIRDAQRHISSLTGEPPQAVAEGAVVDSPIVTTQVQLVDLIQLLVERGGAAVPRVSVILSAFDLVTEHSPREWLAMNMPLLAQYLDSAEDFEPRLFGVSAQGGNFDNAETQAEMLQRGAVERAFARDSNGAHVDLTEPLTWAAGFEDGSG